MGKDHLNKSLRGKIFRGESDVRKGSQVEKFQARQVTISEIRETRLKDLQVELKCASKDRGRLDSAFRDVVYDSGYVQHLVPTVKVAIMGIDPAAEAEAVEEVIRSQASDPLTGRTSGKSRSTRRI